ncbi:MAG: DsbC family protein [Candidatus Accumulibacter sp.]|jgi:thiol:disulfide interchange protein DsbC|nr:DsbC family protein [Accumulibacter sp.]
MKKSISISKSSLLAACAAFLLPWCASAQNDTIEARIKEGVEARWGGSTSSVTKTPYLGLYEVFHEGEVFYTDENLTVFLLGPMIDARTFKNVTAERLQRLMAINFSELPFKFAIKQVRGNGKHVVASFEDPNCGYCKRLAQDMAVLDNVTIYTFLYPILSQDSLEKSKQIWCSKDRVKAWNAWMRDGNEPASKGDCDTSAILRTRELGQRLKITGTPTLFFSDGLRFPGAMPIERIKLKLFGGQPAAQTPQTNRGRAPQAGKGATPKTSGSDKKP